MDINTNSYSTSNSTFTSTTNATNKTKSKASKSDSSTTASTTARTDGYESSSNRKVTGLYTKPQNKLTDEQIQALQDAQAESKKNLIEALSASLTIGQGSNALTASSILDGSIFTSEFCSYTCELPALATDPTEAQAAISEGGAYSVDAVATRIMDLATALAGDDEAMLAKMRSAVEKGFGMARSTFLRVTGENKLPQVCQDTYKEVMSRFDKLQNKSTEDSDNTKEPTTETEKSNNSQTK